MPANNEIGVKIKEIRELRGVSIEDLSERCAISVEQINKIEAGDSTASLTPLLKIARGLGVRLGTFLDDIEQSSPVITRACDGSKVVRFAGSCDKNGLDFHALAANKRDRNMEPFIIDVHRPCCSNFELSSHEGEEFIFVLAGELEIAYGKECYHLAAGDSIYYDSIVDHLVTANNMSEAKILGVIYAPA